MRLSTGQALLVIATLVGCVLIQSGLAFGACPAPLPSLPAGQVDVSLARAVGISVPDAPSGVQRVSGVRLAGESFVMDVNWGAPLIRPLRNSVTRSLPPTISNLRAEVFPNDVTVCGVVFPDRVQLSFDYEDCNADVLGGRATVAYLATGGGIGPIAGYLEMTFFRSPYHTLTSSTAAVGTASLLTCWSSAVEQHIDFSVRLVDADENRSVETLTVSVTIP